MKIWVLICGLLASSLSFGADWVYVNSSNSESFWVDKGFYKYNVKNNTVDVWNKAIKKKSNSNDFYTSSKSLERYSCMDKSSKNLAYVEYKESGEVSKSYSTPSKSFSVIFPDSIAEGIWEVACSSKGRGFRFSKKQLETLSVFEMQEKYAKNAPYEPEYVPESLISDK
ncbi:surface-adhesin E family protein [Acinetobacter guillouiae]|jgi:hypothetical protein|uniref:surface-adhesin E family protein n=1 Tax=Acinetobacter guillouiae TaxID=106649 RepID=UPI00300A3226